jgi:ammonium transporter, Amt family
MKSKPHISSPILLAATTFLWAGSVAAQGAETPADPSFMINNLWILVAALLVFIMHLGFATLEAGLTQAKNTVNILFKNVSILAIGILTYALVGFNLMYPGDAFAGGVFGFSGFGLDPGISGLTSTYNPGYTYWTDFLFQAMFAATAATIVSGAVAERVKLHSFLAFSAIYVALVYPIVGMWHWGGGWLATSGFHDFAGSTIVHSVGGWAALVGIIMIGPRVGKYKDGEIHPIQGHSLPLATIGVFLLWFGWYGFNGGSVLSANPASVSTVFVMTTLAATAGVLTSGLASTFFQGKPDLTMVLNGALAGLVGITAGADVMGPIASITIGGIAGLLVVGSVLLLDQLRLDDPVGAVSVHLVAGIWGTLAVGIFSPNTSIVTQLYGVLATGAFSIVASATLFSTISYFWGLRVSEEVESRGLDIDEHGMEAYAGFAFSAANLVPIPVPIPSQVAGSASLLSRALPGRIQEFADISGSEPIDQPLTCRDHSLSA